ncbi:MAG: dimethyl sulfoxide reductase anchor subunit [Anaerolineales bacterium]|nr:dimethyl sulfoxide reductase anchor subunit [Anaerolineales bacterium]
MNVREWALPVYTILMQLATGILFILWLIRSSKMQRVSSTDIDKLFRRPILVVFFTILLAIIGSHFHLSNPLLSFLAIRNIKDSWLSREIVFTILMFFSCAALVDQIWKPDKKSQHSTFILGWSAILFGGISIYCMSHIYLLPTQTSWNHWTTILMFFSSSIVLGTTSAVTLLFMDTIFIQKEEPQLAEIRSDILKRSLLMLGYLAIAGFIMVVILNVTQINRMQGGDEHLNISLSLLFDLYQPLVIFRFLILFAGIGVFILTAFWLIKKGKTLTELVVPIYLSCLFVLVAEILGRFLFYATHVRLGI